MSEIHIEYFAVLREHTGIAAERVETSAGTVAELYAELDARYDFPAMGQLKAAVNDEFADWNAALSSGDAVVFIPPVAGG